LSSLEEVVITMKSDEKVVKRCYENNLKTKRGVCAVTTQPPREDGVRQIREIQYPKWLANVVLDKKTNGKWRMCVNFTDLNKACPKDSYPLPSIDALVDSASGCTLLSFLDAFSRYNQIWMHPGRVQDSVHDGAFLSLLQNDAFWAQERRGHLLEVDGQSACAHDRAKCPSICGRHGGHLSGERSTRC